MEASGRHLGAYWRQLGASSEAAGRHLGQIWAKWEEVDKLYAKYENLKIGEKKQGIGRKVPLGYMGSPKDITGLSVFLASDESRYITAGTHKVDGGGVWV